MTERLKTAAFVMAAALLVLAAVWVQPERHTPSLMSDQGEAFYPEFRDPQAVKIVEVVDYDEPTATARPLKVEFRNRRWVIASNNDYPIDVGDRLVKTAAALIDLRKDQVRSDSAQDQARYGVIDPLDQKVSSLQGRGKRVTLRAADKNVLADYILGKAVEGKSGWRYVRIPGQKRTYAVQTDADPSARFADWVNAGLLRIPASAIRRVTILNYMLDQTMGRLDQMETITLMQENGQWRSSGTDAVNQSAAKALAATLDGLKIVDARPKPPSLAQDLREGKFQLSLETVMSLRQKGFAVAQNGRIFANEGEELVETGNGALYHLRFGEVATSSTGGGENRYLFVVANWDAARAQKYGDTSGAGEKAARDLNARFADWYYVISGADFQKLRLRKKDVLR